MNSTNDSQSIPTASNTVKIYCGSKQPQQCNIFTINPNSLKQCKGSTINLNSFKYCKKSTINHNSFKHYKRSTTDLIASNATRDRVLIPTALNTANDPKLISIASNPVRDWLMIPTASKATRDTQLIATALHPVRYRLLILKELNAARNHKSIQEFQMLQGVNCWSK